MDIYDAELWGMMTQVCIRANYMKRADELVKEMKSHGPVSASSLLTLALLTKRSDPVNMNTLNYISNNPDIEITASYAAIGASIMMFNYEPVDAIKFYHIHTLRSRSSDLTSFVFVALTVLSSTQKATSPQFWPQIALVDINALFEFLELLSMYAYRKVFVEPEIAAHHKQQQQDAQKWVKHLFDHFVLLLLEEQSAPKLVLLHPRMLSIPVIMFEAIGPCPSMIAWLSYFLESSTASTPLTIPTAKLLINHLETLKLVPHGLWDSFATRWNVRAGGVAQTRNFLIFLVTLAQD
jgi:hypothetical protein